MFGFEMDILKFLEGLRNDFLNTLFEFITVFGEETLLVFLIVTLWFAFDKKFAQKLLFITMASMSVNGVIKNIAQVPRPFASGEVTCVRPETATGYSFPSGHTQNFTTWTSLTAMQLKKKWFTVPVTILILLVAFSRVYLGAHYPSDVVVSVVLGTAFGTIGSIVYDKTENKQKLYIGMTLILTPFAVLFMFDAEPLFEDFYKFYGMVAGIGVAVCFEEKYAPIGYDVSKWKKVLRIVIGIVVAFAVKEGVKVLKVTDIVQLSFVIDAVRYFLLVFAVMGLCPVLFKKCRI
ncbi:MAG: phosphatase PAP2 family protein [Oscillospiraceae bacterium]|nr:phosphatase PAP2 family protein [Oscillospiraceae bacterium]